MINIRVFRAGDGKGGGWMIQLRTHTPYIRDVGPVCILPSPLQIFETQGFNDTCTIILLFME